CSRQPALPVGSRQCIDSRRGEKGRSATTNLSRVCPTSVCLAKFRCIVRRAEIAWTLKNGSCGQENLPCTRLQPKAYSLLAICPSSRSCGRCRSSDPGGGRCAR